MQTTFHHRACGLTNVGLLSSFPRMPAYEGAVEPSIEIIGDMVRGEWRRVVVKLDMPFRFDVTEALSIAPVSW